MSDQTTDQTVGQFTMYSPPWCGYCHRLKSQLDREGIEFQVVDIEQEPAAAYPLTMTHASRLEAAGGCLAAASDPRQPS